MDAVPAIPPKNSASNDSSSAKEGSHSRQPSRTSQTAVRIGPYLVGKTLGVGSTGRVKLGTHIETSQKVAVKIISKNQIRKDKDDKERKPADPKTINRKLEREISIMKIIQHPSILSLYDVYESEDELYLILEYVEGGELFDYLVKQGRIKEQEALNFFQQIIAGVDYCHKHLICHRDLKPENLLLDSKRNIKIADFGMAALQPPGKFLETSCGSPHYASPEIIRGQKYDGALADIWSCGVILYALLTGNLPFDDENIRKLLQKVKLGVYSIPDWTPPDGADLIRRMLEVNPSKRITIAEIEQHPWFRKRPYTWANRGLGPLRNPPTPDSLKPITKEDVENGLVDLEILGSLRLLGYGSEKEILQSLMTPAPNYEKVFYSVLKQRKTESLENYEEDPADIRSPRRRINSTSRGSLYQERAQSNTSLGSQNISQTELSPVNQQELRKSITNTSGDEQVSITIPSSSTSSRHANDAPKRRSYNPSPLSTTVKPAVSDEENASHKDAALITLDSRRVSSATGTSSHPKRSSIMSDMRKKLSSHESTDATQSLPILLHVPGSLEPAAGSDQNRRILQQVTDSQPSPRMERLSVGAGQVVQSISISSPTLLMDPSNLASTDSSVPPSPVISNSPKKSWFASLFNFKPESYSFMSYWTPDVTRQYLELALQRAHVQFQHSRDGISLKCKYIPITSPTVAETFVKFKISLAPGSTAEDSGNPSMTGTPTQPQTGKGAMQGIEVVCMQQQGSLSAFQQFQQAFQQEWTRLIADKTM